MLKGKKVLIYFVTGCRSFSHSSRLSFCQKYSLHVEELESSLLRLENRVVNMLLDSSL